LFYRHRLKLGQAAMRTILYRIETAFHQLISLLEGEK
jgi:hypothetical protein